MFDLSISFGIALLLFTLPAFVAGLLLGMLW